VKELKSIRTCQSHCRN